MTGLIHDLKRFLHVLRLYKLCLDLMKEWRLIDKHWLKGVLLDVHVKHKPSYMLIALNSNVSDVILSVEQEFVMGILTSL
jgi:hypothetical protein